MNLLLPDSGLLFWMTIIFLIVFFILAKFGFPVITGMVEKRTKRIDEALKAAKKAEDAIAHLEQEQERLMAETRNQQAKLLQEAASERDRIISQAKEQAAAEAGKIIDDAKVRIEREKEEALRDMRREVALMSIKIAEKVVRKDLESDGAQKQLVDKLLDEIQ